MEYNELITRAQRAAVDSPDTDAILTGMHRTLRRRRQQRNANQHYDAKPSHFPE